MLARIHRGANEIGGSCIELRACGETILLDAGMPLNTLDGAPPSLPPVDPERVSAVIISHSHIDHYGRLPCLPGVPVVMGNIARRIVTVASQFMPENNPTLTGPTLVNRQPVEIGPFRVTPYIVDHSAYDAYALLVEAGGKRLLYSGDWRQHGRKGKLVEQLMAKPPRGIDTLLLEGTTVGRVDPKEKPTTEDELEGRFAEVFQETSGMALVHVSAQNIDRLVSVFRACLKTKRILLIDLYAAMVLEATGNPRVPQSWWTNVALCIPQAQRRQIKRNGWFAELQRHSRRRLYLKDQVAENPGKYVLLFRPLWIPDLEDAGCLNGGCFIHSQWHGYLSEPRFREVEEWRNHHHLPFHIVHTSGHASVDDLRRFANSLNPKKVVPIHTAFPEGFYQLYENAAIYSNGEWWEV